MFPTSRSCWLEKYEKVKRSQEPNVNEMFNYIEDGDLWRWRLPDGKAFYAGLAALGLDYDANQNPGIFDTLLTLSPDMLIQRVRSRPTSILSASSRHCHWRC
jgi:hypothetical protein